MIDYEILQGIKLKHIRVGVSSANDLVATRGGVPANGGSGSTTPERRRRPALLVSLRALRTQLSNGLPHTPPVLCTTKVHVSNFDNLLGMKSLDIGWLDKVCSIWRGSVRTNHFLLYCQFMILCPLAVHAV